MKMKKVFLTICLVFVFSVCGIAKATLNPAVTSGRDDDIVVEPVLIHSEDYYFPGADIEVSYINYDNGSCVAGVDLKLGNHLVDSFDWDFQIQGTGFEPVEPHSWCAIFSIAGPFGELTSDSDRYQRSELSSYGMDIGTYTWITFIPGENIYDYDITATFTANPASIVSTNFFFDDEGDHWSAQYLIDGVIIPEPATILLLGAGSLGFICRRRRFR